MSALTVSDLSKRYGGVLALSGVSFTVEPGERRALIGPNGAGKTTLFHSISGRVAERPERSPSSIRRSPGCRRTSAPRLGMARTFQVTNLFSA